MAWSRWVARPGPWLARLAAGLGVVLLAALVHDWLPRTDVFVIYRKNCPPRMGSFWPLLFVWLCGTGLQTFAVWGKSFRPLAARTLSLQSIAWWVLTVLWAGALAYVFVRNINMAVLGISLLGAGKMVGGIALVVGAIIGAGWLLSLAGRKEQKQATADYQKMDVSTRTEILNMIDRHSRAGDYRLLYRTSSGSDTQLSMARIGGVPLMHPDEAWPTDMGGAPNAFLLQLPLMAPQLESWKGRLIAVYLTQHELLVKSYSEALIDELVPRANPSADLLVEPQCLQALAVPNVPVTSDAEEDEDQECEGVDVERLVKDVKGLMPMLTALTAYPELVLSKVLAGHADARSFEAEGAILVGGSPVFIQGAHEPECTICHQPMRFLFLFADVTENSELGDCGVGYIYGCDVHPEHCQGFIDCF